MMHCQGLGMLAQTCWMVWRCCVLYNKQILQITPALKDYEIVHERKTCQVIKILTFWKYILCYFLLNKFFVYWLSLITAPLHLKEQGLGSVRHYAHNILWAKKKNKCLATGSAQQYPLKRSHESCTWSSFYFSWNITSGYTSFGGSILPETLRLDITSFGGPSKIA